MTPAGRAGDANAPTDNGAATPSSATPSSATRTYASDASRDARGAAGRAAATAHPIVTAEASEPAHQAARDQGADQGADRGADRESWYHTLFEMVDQGVGLAEILADDAGRAVDYRMLAINPQFERLTGQSHERFLAGRTVREVAPELEEHWYAFYGGVALTGAPAHAEIHAAAWDRWFEVSAYRVGDPARRRVVILFTDVTARRAADAEAARAAADLERRRLLAVLEELPVGVHVADAPTGRLVLDNAAVRAICGEAPRSERVADYSADYAGHYPPGHPRAGDALASDAWPLARTLTTGEAVREELVEIRRGDGTRRLVSVSAAPVRDADGRLVGGVATNVDVTERERLLAESERARAEADAARHEAEHARAEAEHARAEAEQANRAKSEFLATMSHEIRTPINAQIGYAELLDLGIAGPLTEAQRTYLMRLTASSRHLLALVTDVLDMVKVDAGELSIQRALALTGAAVAAALDLVQPQADAKGVRLVDLRPGEPGEPYVGDEHRVRQIVLNLLANAVKFTPAGGEVTIHCGQEAEADPAVAVYGNGPWATIRVRDTGVGIAPEQQGRLFLPFQQLPEPDAAGRTNVYTRRPAGTGLGLAISRRLARLMGGDLALERSAAGEGSTFTLWLPATDAAETPEARRVRAERAPLPLGAAGLDRLGTLLRESADTVLRSYVARLRADPRTPGARRLETAPLEDHTASLLADLAQSLVIVGGARGHVTERAALLADGSAIQRVIAEHHGRRRYLQGWTADAVARDHEVLAEELERAIRTRLAADQVTAEEALGVLRQLLARGCELSLAAWHRAADGASSGELLARGCELSLAAWHRAADRASSGDGSTGVPASGGSDRRPAAPPAERDARSGL